MTLCDSRVTHQLPLNSTEIVGRDCFPGLRVSTVWLPASEETLETVIFKRLLGDQLGEEIYSERYASYKAAERGHVRICTLVRDIQEAYPQPAQMSRAEMDKLIAASNVAFHGRSR